MLMRCGGTSVFQSLSNTAHIPPPQDRADAWFTALFLCYRDISAAKQYSAQRLFSFPPLPA